MKKIIIILLCLITFNVNADVISLKAKSSILIDQNTGSILYANNENERLPMASMTKIMSLLLIFEQINIGNISYDDDVLISQNAMDMGGSQVYLNAGETYTVKELIKSVAMASANDAIVALAEKTYGSTENFVNKMNEKVVELGLTNTHFDNVHGLDSENHYSSCYDMAMIAKELLKYEDVLTFTGVYEDYLTKKDGSQIWLVNTNKLVKFYDGVDGLKTGYTAGAGYCLTATGKKNNLRLISVVMGEESIDNRSDDTVKLLNYGFNTYKVNLIKKKGDIVGNIKVEKGKVNNTDVVLEKDIIELLRTTEESSNYHYELSIDKIIAPVNKNDIVGNVKVYDDENNLINETNIMVKDNIDKANIFDYIINNIKCLSAFKVK